MQCKKLFAFTIFALCLDCTVFSQAPAQEDFPKLIFVTARAGLRGRSEPSTSGRIIETRQYGDFFQIHGRQDNPVTIDGITDYWHRVGDPNDRGWLIITWYFGGYLSEDLPADLPVVIGLWDFAEDLALYEKLQADGKGSGIIARSMAFRNDFTFAVGHKETSSGQRGTWSITNNVITLVLETFPDQEWPDLIDVEYVTVYVQINIIDKRNIELTFSQEVYGMTKARLVRNRDGW